MAKAKGSKQEPMANKSELRNAKSTKASGVKKSNRPKEPSVDRKITTMPAVDEPPSNSFPIAGIGASAGGLEALEELLRHMPEFSSLMITP